MLSMIDGRAKLIKCKTARHNQARTFAVTARGSGCMYYNNAFCGYKNWFIPHGGGIVGGGITPGDFSNQFF